MELGITDELELGIIEEMGLGMDDGVGVGRVYARMYVRVTHTRPPRSVSYIDT